MSTTTGSGSVESTTSLSIDGKVDASDAADMLTQRMLAHVPLLLHPAPKKAAILGLGSGVSIANPVPAEDEMDRSDIDAVIDRALADCDERGIHGKDITPYLLDRFHRETDGVSMEASVRLVMRNAALAAQIARATA